MINYNLQQSPQSPRVTATPVDRTEWAEDLESLSNTLSSAIKTAGKAYQQSAEAAAKAESTRLLNQFESDVYNLKSEFNRTPHPSPSEFQDRLQKLRELPQYQQTLKASDMNAVITSLGIESITPGWMQAAKTEAAEDAKRIAEERQQLYDLGIARLGIDQASEMSYDSIVEIGKKVASDGQAISLAVQNINDPNASPQIKDMSLNMTAEVLSENVGYDIDKAIGANQKITRVMLNQERDKIAYDLRTNKGLLAADAVYIANQAVKKWEPLVAMTEMSLKDQATFAAQQSKAADDLLSLKRAEITGISSSDWKALGDIYYALPDDVREAYNSSLLTYFGDAEQNRKMINALTGGNPTDLKTTGENLSKALAGLSTTRQKTSALLSALNIYNNSINEEVASMANKTPQEFTQDMQNAVDNYFWLGNKLSQNIQAMDEALGNAEQFEKDYAKTTYTDAISDLSKYKLIDATVNTRGELSLVDGYLRSNNSLDRDKVKEINDILADAYNTNEKSGGLLLDKEALTRNLKRYIEDYKLAKEDNLQWWQYPAMVAMPVKAMGSLGRTPRRQALAEQAGDTTEPWLNTFQGALTGAEVGAVVGGAPGALIGGGVGGLGVATAEIARRNLPSPVEAYNLASDVSQRVREAGGNLIGKAVQKIEDENNKRSGNFIDFIKGYESFRPVVYTDVDQPAIGYGFRLSTLQNAPKETKEKLESIAPGSTKEGFNSITKEQASEILPILVEDIYTPEAKKFVGENWENLPELVKEAVIDMDYNMGYERTKPDGTKGGLITFADFRKALQKGDLLEAAKEIEDSAYFRDKGSHDRAVANIHKILRSLQY